MFEGIALGALLALTTTLPLAWKWHLGLLRGFVTILIFAILSGATIALCSRVTMPGVAATAFAVWFATLSAAFALLAYRFYRDPDRTVPQGDGLIVSPADGEVIYVRETREGILPVATKQGRNYRLEELTKTRLHSQDAVVVGIGMTFLDVHVNRAPITGRITLQRHFPGLFGSLRVPEMVFQNERMTTIIEQGDLQLGIVQIASRLVRQIVSYVREGQEMKIGQRIGMIRFGSQVDVIIPAGAGLRLAVKTGDVVKAGESVLANYSFVGEVRPGRPANGQLMNGLVRDPAGHEHKPATLESSYSTSPPAQARPYVLVDNRREETASVFRSNPADAVRMIALNPQTDTRWEQFRATHPHGLVYHHPLWLQVIEQTYGGELLALACEDCRGRLSGVLPMFLTRGLLTGDRLSSLPHTPVAGPIANDAESMSALVGAAVQLVRAKEGAQLQLKTSQAGVDRLVSGLIVSPWEETYALDLPTRPETLRFGGSRNHSRIRWAINKAAKCGVRVRLAESEHDLRDWYSLYLDTMRWHAVPPRSYKFFRKAWDILRPGGLMRLLLAEEHQAGKFKMLAGSIFLMFGGTVFYAFNGRRRDALSLRPNDLIQWHAIHDACSNGYRRYDFGEVDESNQGLAEFKSKWGAEPYRLYRCYYPASRELETGLLRQDRIARRCATAVWRQLPLKTTAVLGDWLYRHV